MSKQINANIQGDRVYSKVGTNLYVLIVDTNLPLTTTTNLQFEPSTITEPNMVYITNIPPIGPDPAVGIFGFNEGGIYTITITIKANIPIQVLSQQYTELIMVAAYVLDGPFATFSFVQSDNVFPATSNAYNVNICNSYTGYFGQGQGFKILCTNARGNTMTALRAGTAVTISRVY